MSITGSDGAINKFMALFGVEPVTMINSSKHFDFLYIGSNIWQRFGYGTIIYIAAMSAVDPTLYQAATVDGANRLQKMFHITLPSIIPTIIVLLILSIGTLMSARTEKILLMINPLTTDRADVIGTYVYKVGLKDAKYSYSAAVGLFTNIINFVLVFGANLVSRRTTNYSLW